MKFIPSENIKILLLPNQVDELCSSDIIAKISKKEGVVSFDIYDDDLLIGFAQMHEFEKNSFFLWNYAIDYKYQNKGYGVKALIELIDYMKSNYNLKIMTTTYLFGNNHAKHVYEKVGFIETDVVDEDGCHEVNMTYK